VLDEREVKEAGRGETLGVTARKKRINQNLKLGEARKSEKEFSTKEVPGKNWKHRPWGKAKTTPLGES